MSNIRQSGLNLRIKEENIEEWDKVAKKNSFANEVINNYLNKKIVEINLSSETQKKFNEDHDRNYVLNKLITEYYNNNILFISEYKRMLEINNKLTSISSNNGCGIETNQGIFNGEKKNNTVENSYDNEEAIDKLNSDNRASIETVEEQEELVEAQDSFKRKEKEVSEEILPDRDLNEGKKEKSKSFARAFSKN